MTITKNKFERLLNKYCVAKVSFANGKFLVKVFNDRSLKYIPSMIDGIKVQSVVVNNPKTTGHKGSQYYDPHIPDEEPGMPSIHSVKGGRSKLSKEKLFGYMMEKKMHNNIISKLDNAFRANHLVTVINESKKRKSSTFKNQDEFKKHLVEGVVLDINCDAAKIIGIPIGKYTNYYTDAISMTLIPVAKSAIKEGIFDEIKIFDVLLESVLNCWDKIDRTIFEADNDKKDEEDKEDETLNDLTKKHRAEKNTMHQRDQTIKQEIDNSPMTQSELADVAGVDKSTISRLTAKDGTPSHRDPSVNTLKALNAAGIDTDVFITGKEPSSTKRRANRGSGDNGKKKNKTYHKGDKE